MNIKEAREILSKENHLCHGGCDSEWHESEAKAQGFLEGYEQGVNDAYKIIHEWGLTEKDIDVTLFNEVLSLLPPKEQKK